jgi:hypothetical protein
MRIESEQINIKGTTYSTANSGVYDFFNKTKDAGLFENLIQDLMLKKYSDEEVKDYIISLPKREQRLAIMSLIDKETKGDNNLLWSEMVSYVESRTDKMDHIKDVIRIINKFVKDGSVEKKSFGEVMTPITLVKEMLDTLPKDVWSNPNLKWLDPANGAGTFPFVVIYKLMNGLKEWEPDVEKRYKHIVENMIYVCELQSRNVFLWLCGLDPHDEYTSNTYWGSFLDEGFKKHTKEVWNIEKFDIVIGNPPYQDVNEKGETKHGSGKLYPEFIKESINLLKNDGHLLFVNPNTWFSGSDQSSTGKLLSLIKRYNLINLNTESSGVSLQKKFFDGVGTGELTHFLLKKNQKYTKTLVNGRFYINLNEHVILPNILNENTLSLIKKTLFNNGRKIKIAKDSGEYHDKKTTRNDNKLISKKYIDGYFPIVNSITKKEGIKLLFMPYANYFQNNIKILISQSSSFENLIIDNGQYGFTQNVTAIICESIDEANTIKSLLNHPLYDYLISLTKYGPAISPRMLSLLPLLESTTNIEEYFGLTKNEINLFKN